jgi:predicted aspartyl protease
MRLAIPFLVVLLLLNWSACTIPAPKQLGEPAETTPGEVSFEFAAPNDAAILVPVKINGQGPYKFVLDTGATFTCVDQKLVNRLNLPEWRGVGFGVITPTEGNVKLVTMNMFEVGQAKATDLKACTIDLLQMQKAGLDVNGLVGLNFLKSFQLTIDFKKKVLRLEKP